MSKINQIKQSVKAALQGLSVPVYTERVINKPGKKYATVHLSEWERTGVRFGQGLKMSGTLVVEYGAPSDEQVEALSDSGFQLLADDQPLLECIEHIGFEGAEFTDAEKGVALAQRWAIKFIQPLKSN